MRRFEAERYPPGMAPTAAERDDAKHSIRMTADRLLVLPSDEAGDRKSRGGILIPATANRDRPERSSRRIVQSPFTTIARIRCCGVGRASAPNRFAIGKGIAR